MALNMNALARWAAAYQGACETNDPSAAAAIFTRDAVYYTTPFEKPWEGRDEIVANWAETEEVHEGFECRCDPVAVTGDTGVLRWWAIYPATGNEFSSVFVIRFEDDGRAAEFREWYMARDRDE